MSLIGPSLQVSPSNKLVAIGATTDIRTRHALVQMMRLTPNGH